MKKFTSGAATSALAIAVASPAIAQDTTEEAQERTGGVEVIVVTAQKRSEDLQDVPISVQALGAEGLEELNIDTFEDYLDQLPTVTAGGSGPGQSTIYIRGLASTTPNLTTAGVAGLAPNVSLYLDEQPLAQPGRNLDVYAADLERIEVLSGPQGTLFGASSQAGVVRLITAKPELSGFDAAASAGVSFTKDGEASYKTEVMVNVPVTDNFGLRGVVFLDDQGGYIDNVQGTRTARESGRFRPAGTVRSNGVVVNQARAGFQSDPATLAAIDANVNFLAADNSGLVEEDFNDTQYTGFRVTGLYEFSADWRVTVAHTRQSVESDGVFFADPTLNGLDDLEVQRYEQDRLEDDFSNTSWTIEGRLGALDLVYTGAYTNRETEQRVDYTDYLFVGQYLPYYICDAAVTYPTYVASTPDTPTGTCQAPNSLVDSTSDLEVMTHEFRVSTPAENRFRVTAGAFYSDLELVERNDFTYLGSQFALGADNATPGFLPNYPLTNVDAPPGAVGNASPGFFSDPGPFSDPVIFRNDIRRTDEQFGLFGEASFDIVPDLLSITAGARYYDISVDLEGSANGSFVNRISTAFGPNNVVPVNQRQDAQLGGSNLDLLYGPNNAFGNPESADSDGFIFKGTVTVTPTPDLLFYATYSEGFRPGLLNRPGGVTSGTFTVPFALETDEVANYELGWKTDLVDGQLRVNGSAFYVDITNLQTSIFDPSITNLFFADNAANAEIYGVEADFTFAPYSVPGLTVAGAFSLLDTEITERLTPTDDVIVGQPLAFAPEFQGNMRIRYEWDLSNTLEAFIQPQVTHSASKFTDIIEINKIKLDSYTVFDLAAGVMADQWKFEVFGENLFDERAQISGNYVNDRARITTNRPLTVGFRVSYDY